MTARFMSRPSRDTVQVLAYLDDVGEFSFLQQPHSD